jgi:hypothetical protein
MLVFFASETIKDEPFFMAGCIFIVVSILAAAIIGLSYDSGGEYVEENRLSVSVREVVIESLPNQKYNITLNNELYYEDVIIFGSMSDEVEVAHIIGGKYARSIGWFSLGVDTDADLRIQLE